MKGGINISQKYKQMDKHFQIWNALRIIQKEIDYFSEIDSTLHFPENLELLQLKYGRFYENN